jgi:hypothetical protein
VTKLIIGLLALGHVLIWFVRGGWRPVAWWLLGASGALVLIFCQLTGWLAVFYTYCAVSYRESFYVYDPTLSLALSILIPRLLGRLLRAQWFGNFVVRITPQDRREI